MLHRFKVADDDVNKTPMTSAGADDVSDDVSALATDDSSVLSVRKSSHHGHSSFCLRRYRKGYEILR